MNEFQLDHRRFKVLESGAPVWEADIAELERKTGSSLPTQLRSYYLRWNGGLPYPLDLPEYESVWFRMQWKAGSEAASVGPAADFGGLMCINAKPDRDFFRTWLDFKHRIPGDCVGFARAAGGASLLLIGTQPHNLGQIYYWERSHEPDIEGGSHPGYDNVAYVAGSLKDFLLDLREEPRRGESSEDWVLRVYRE